MDNNNEYNIFSEYKAHKTDYELTPFDCDMEEDPVSGFEFQDMAYWIDNYSNHFDAVINRW